MYCAKCGRLQEESAFSKISFRAECTGCGASLHSCVHCKYYQVGLPNDCKVPGTERVIDKEASNFCEEFAPTSEKKAIQESPSKKKFEDLFK